MLETAYWDFVFYIDKFFERSGDVVCPVCNKEVKIKVMTSNIDNAKDSFYHIYLCKSCNEPFLTVEKILTKKETEQLKGRMTEK